MKVLEDGSDVAWKDLTLLVVTLLVVMWLGKT